MSLIPIQQAKVAEEAQLNKDPVRHATFAGSKCSRIEDRKMMAIRNVAVDPNLLKESKCQIMMEKTWDIKASL